MQHDIDLRLGVTATGLDTDARILSTDLRLGVPWYAYDTLTLSGQVVEVEGQLVTVGVTGTGVLGKHIVATTRLLPPEDPVP